uniref:Uncharacterized protein n=1 Tax=Anguilla anguilla TaxID=7936 RepID=A0A0E9PW14_ANGAN
MNSCRTSEPNFPIPKNLPAASATDLIMSDLVSFPLVAYTTSAIKATKNLFEPQLYLMT